MGHYGNRPPEGLKIIGMAASTAELRIAITRLPEIRAEKVLAIQRALNEGKYRIDSRKVARVLIDEVI